MASSLVLPVLTALESTEHCYADTKYSSSVLKRMYRFLTVASRGGPFRVDEARDSMLAH
jgi:hypothetical protein